MLVVWNAAEPESRKFVFPGEIARTEEGSYFVSGMNLLPSNSIPSCSTFSPGPDAAGANGTSRALPLLPSASWSHAPGWRLPREAKARCKRGRAAARTGRGEGGRRAGGGGSGGAAAAAGEN